MSDINLRDPLEYFEKIELRDPADIVIQQIKELISSGRLRSKTSLMRVGLKKSFFNTSRSIFSCPIR